MKDHLAPLETAFAHLAEKASRADGRFFMHRDFQSRNIMVKGESIGIIDWQGGRLGPLGYDLSSILCDPYVRLSLSRKRELYDAYLNLLKEHNSCMGRASSNGTTRTWRFNASLQILGAFSFLSKVMQEDLF